MGHDDGPQERLGPHTPLIAVPVGDDEVWQRSTGIYGGCDRYQERITGRSVRVFVLDPA